MKLIYTPATKKVYPSTTSKVISMLKTLVEFYGITDFSTLQSSFKSDLNLIKSGNHSNPNDTYKLVEVKDERENVTALKLMYTPAQTETVLGTIEKDI